MKGSRILFIRGGAIGDFILSLPILMAVREVNPGAQIELLAYPSIASLGVGPRLGHSICRLDDVKFASLFSSESSVSEELCDYVASFDLVVLVWSDRDGVMRRNLMRSGARRLVHIDPFPPAGPPVHVIDHMAAVLESQGIRCQERVPHIEPPQESSAFAESWFGHWGASPGRVCAVHPGSGGRSKAWPAERFAEIINYILEGRETRVILVIGPADVEPAEKLSKLIEHPRVRVARELYLPHLAALLRRCCIFLGNDSGITHLAAAVGTQTIALFGPTDPQIWGPRGKHVRIVRSHPPGSPIHNIPTQTIRDLVEEMLLASGKRPSS